MERNRRTLEGIQYLRGIAALLVVVQHFRGNLPIAVPDFGFVGVDIFFVISGFVMAYTTHGFAAVRGRREKLRDAGNFIVKRLVRIVPLWWLALLWTARRELWRGEHVDGLALDFFFVPHASSKYTEALLPFVMQGWTLNYEMFFYALFATSLLVWTLRAYTVIPVLILLSLLGYALGVHGVAPNIHTVGGVALKFCTEDIVLEFGAGIIAHGLWRSEAPNRLPVPMRWATLALATVALIAVADAAGETSAYRGALLSLPATLIVLGTVALGAGTHFAWLRLLGDASYAIYLFHWASFGAMKPLVAALSPDRLGVLTLPVLTCLYMACAVVSGILIHKLIEKPLLSVLHSLSAPLTRAAYKRASG